MQDTGASNSFIIWQYPHDQNYQPWHESRTQCNWPWHRANWIPNTGSDTAVTGDIPDKELGHLKFQQYFNSANFDSNVPTFRWICCERSQNENRNISFRQNINLVHDRLLLTHPRPRGVIRGKKKKKKKERKKEKTEKREKREKRKKGTMNNVKLLHIKCCFFSNFSFVRWHWTIYTIPPPPKKKLKWRPCLVLDIFTKTYACFGVLTWAF